MASLIKSVLFLSVFMLLGAGFVPRFMYRRLWPRGLGRVFRASTATGAVLLLLATAADLAATVHGVLGFLEPDLLFSYLTGTGHGYWSLVRAGAVLALAALAFIPALAPRPDDRQPDVPALRLAGNTLYLLAGVLVAVSFSRVSHNASMGGILPVPADLIHLLAAVSWGSALAFLAFLPVWNELSRPELERAVARLSRLGTAAVALLFISGTYSGFLHISSTAGLTGTLYGRSLLVKVLLVLVITGLAGLNRFMLLPRLRQYGPARPLRHAMQAETVLLLAVLFMTGLLSTSPMPH
jgi:putative copper export protein